MNKKSRINRILSFVVIIGIAISTFPMFDSNVMAYDGIRVKEAGFQYAVLDNGDFYDWEYPVLLPEKKMENVAHVELSPAINNFYSVITKNGDLYRWGNNGLCGIVGNSSTEYVREPYKVLSDIKDVKTGKIIGTTTRANFTLALKANGDLYCWGYNYNGNVGNGKTDVQLTPRKIMSNIKKIVTTKDISSVITNNGDLYCWGYNGNRKVGNGNTSDQLTPYKVMENVKDAYESFYAMFAIKENGDLYSWGSNYYGEVGNGSTNGQLTPHKVMEDVYSIYGDETIYAVKNNGDLYSWGSNGGRVGNGSTNNQLTPIKILENVYYAENCSAITKNGDLYRWGDNSEGSVGNGSTSKQLTPTKVLGNVREVSHSGDSAITQNGDLYCWGQNDSGYVGDGTTQACLYPKRILSNVAFGQKGSAITENGNLYTWPYNGKITPQLVDFLKPFASIVSTNNLSNEQTAILKLSDDVDVDGYYFGKKNNYEDNNYIKSGAGTVNEKISSSGTYYLTVKDVNGRISETSSITYNTILLDSNGGNVSPSYVLAKGGSQLSLPVPTKNGYTFNGWSDDSKASAGNIKVVIVNSDATYYATWKKTNDLKKEQIIKVFPLVKTFSKKTFKLGVKTNGKAKLVFKSSNTKVAQISKIGRIQMKGYGTTTITVNALENDSYKSATKSILLTVNPPRAKVKSIKSIKNGKIRTKWKKDKKATGYVFQISESKKFKKRISQKYFSRNHSKLTLTFKKQSGKKYYIRIRIYKRIKSIDYYGKWSKVKKIRIK